MTYLSRADLGGTACAEPVHPEPEGELFHAAWEPRVLAMTLAAGATGSWNIDQSRAQRETVADYAALSYYELWLEGLERLLIERGMVGTDELAQGRVLHPPVPVKRVLLAADVDATLMAGSSYQRAHATAPRFQVGNQVHTTAQPADHHTRLPGYARDKVGVIVRINGVHVFPDTNSRGLGEQPQWLYTVEFEGRELWGATAEPGLRVSIDAFEPYLELA